MPDTDHSYDPGNAHGWQADYLAKFGRHICACGHELRYHNHTGARIACVACRCEFFTSRELCNPEKSRRPNDRR